MMDRHFLEFWGNFMLNSAKSQKQLEEVTEWVGKGFSGFDDLTSLFKKVYGLEGTTKESPDHLKAWQKAEKDFKQSMKDYLNLLGMTPLGEDLTLVRKYEALKKKVASQEETIKHLRILLAESQGVPSAEVTRHFDELIKKQSDQFQNLVEGFKKLFQKDSPSERNE